MKFFHTADWHLGKLVQGVYMTDEQKYILRVFVEAIEREKPDAVIIAGDLYDRAVPPPEAVELLDMVLEKIVIELKTPVLVIAGNHDSPSRLNFGSKVMEERGLHIVGRFNKDEPPVILQDEHGEIHFHLIPYCDPSIVKNEFKDDSIKSHQEATEKIIEHRKTMMDENARHVYVGHAFVTPRGEKQENTSESERPLSIGGAEHVAANLFKDFHYTALGHLHQAHRVGQNNIRYAGSPLKYSLSEQHHKKGFYIVDLDKAGNTSIEKKFFFPRRDLREVEATLDEIYNSPINEDYVYVKLLDETPVLSPMEKVRTVYPNAMHVSRGEFGLGFHQDKTTESLDRSELSEIDLMKAFYKEIKGIDPTEATEEILVDVLDSLLKLDNETN